MRYWREVLILVILAMATIFVWQDRRDGGERLTPFPSGKSQPEAEATPPREAPAPGYEYNHWSQVPKENWPGEIAEGVGGARSGSEVKVGQDSKVQHVPAPKLPAGQVTRYCVILVQDLETGTGYCLMPVDKDGQVMNLTGAQVTALTEALSGVCLPMVKPKKSSASPYKNRRGFFAWRSGNLLVWYSPQGDWPLQPIQTPKLQEQ